MKLPPDKENIVAHGRELLRKSEEYKRREIDIRKAISETYKDDLLGTSWIKRLFIKWKMEREIQKALDDIAPPNGLYFTSK